MDVYLEKVVPEDNCFRYYGIRVTPDLFEEASLMVHWGRIGCPGRIAIRGSGSAARCEDIAARIMKKRLKRGYSLGDSGELACKVDPVPPRRRISLRKAPPPGDA